MKARDVLKAIRRSSSVYVYADNSVVPFKVQCDKKDLVESILQTTQGNNIESGFAFRKLEKGRLLLQAEQQPR
jgi:hypothetical protein